MQYINIIVVILLYCVICDNLRNRGGDEVINTLEIGQSIADGKHVCAGIQKKHKRNKTQS